MTHGSQDNRPKEQVRGTARERSYDSTRGSRGVTQWSTILHVERWKEGDPEALGALAERFTPLVRYRVRSHASFGQLSSVLSIDDMIQEVWTRVLGAKPQNFTPTGKGSFAAWLAHLIDSTLVDLLRRIQAQKRGGGKAPDLLDSGTELQAKAMPGVSPPENPVGQAWVSEFERLAGKVLGDRELKAWVWVGLMGFTSEEAALGLSTTSGAVRSLLLRSRSKLREALGSAADTYLGRKPSR